MFAKSLLNGEEPDSVPAVTVYTFPHNRSTLDVFPRA